MSGVICNFYLVFPAFSFLPITIPHPFCYKSTLEVKIKRSKCNGRKTKLDIEAVFLKKKKPRSAPDRDCAIIPQGSHTICLFNRLYSGNFIVNVLYRLLHLLRCIANYVRESMLNKRCVTLPTVNCRPCASEVFKTAILKDFEFAVCWVSFYKFTTSTNSLSSKFTVTNVFLFF